MPSLQNHKVLKSCQEVTFHIPLHCQIPPILFTINDNDFANLLQSASKILEFQKQTAFESLQDDFIKEQIEEKTNELQQEISHRDKQHEREIRRYKEELDDVQEKYKKQTLELEKYRIQNQTIRDTAIELSEKRVEDIKGFNDNLTKRIERLEEQKRELEDKLKERQLILSNAAKRGNEGEKNFQELVELHKKSWHLNRVSKETHTMDFEMNYHGVSIRFEIKNHEKNVPFHNDINKFLDNMKTHSETAVGILIAHTATINGSDAFSVEFSPTNQLLIYVPKFLETFQPSTFDMFETYFKIAKMYHYSMTPSNEEEILSTRIAISTDKAQEMIREIETAHKDFLDVCRHVRSTMTMHTNAVNKLLLSSDKVFLNILASIRDQLQTLSGQDFLNSITQEDEKNLEETYLMGQTEGIQVPKQQRKGAKKSKSTTNAT